MERIDDDHREERPDPSSVPGKNRQGIHRRWVSFCLLPVAVVISASALVFYIYSFLILGQKDSEPVMIVCVGGVVALIALWIMGERFLHSILEPLEQIQSQAKRMTERSFGVRTEKLLDDELGDLTDSLNELDREIARDRAVQSEFISSVSHELRTPLTAIMGWAEALSYEGTPQVDFQRGIGIIEKESARLTKMVAELLDFTRIQDGRFNLNLETVDFAAEVEDALYTYHSLMEQEEIELKYTCDEEEIPEIEGDPERLKQVLVNVLDNAAKYGRDGATIEVSVSAEDDEVVLRVRDHGPGIPEDELPHVKERFYKGSSKERGSGIGLAVCEEIVSRHGGKLIIENADTGGVLVTVRLPVKQAPKKHPASEGKVPVARA